jgi:opine dehydrogenase
MTRLLVLGAGAVGTAAAALAVRRGHAVTLWSPRGGGTHGIGAGLRVSGLLTGRAQVGIAVDVGRALRGAEAALLAVPPAALGVVIRRIAPMLPPSLPVLLMPSQSLAPLLLARLTEGRNPVAALGAPPFEARRLAPDDIALTALAAEADLASVPAAAAPALAALAADLLGVPVRPCPGLMAVLLGRADHVRMASLALLSLTRIERGETWDEAEQATAATCRLMAALDAERLALAAAAGFVLPNLAQSLAGLHGLPAAPLPTIMAALAARGPRPGARALAGAALAGAVPHGLALWVKLAAMRGVPMPLTEASQKLLSLLWQGALPPDDLAAPADLAALR